MSMPSEETNDGLLASSSEQKSRSEQADELDKLIHSKSHVIHTGLFVVSACFTIAFWVTSQDKVPGVEMTHFKMLRFTDVASRNKATTKGEMLRKWQCIDNSTNSSDIATVEPWGPDSMCRCIDSLVCSGEGCHTNETNCYKTRVPSYAYVYGGYMDCFYNIIMAFFFLHIAVMLNMFIESQEDEKQDELEPETSTEQVTADFVLDHGNSVTDTTPPVRVLPEAKKKRRDNRRDTDASAQERTGRRPRQVQFEQAQLGYKFLRAHNADDLHDLSSETSVLISSNYKPWNEKTLTDKIVHSIKMKEFRLFVIFVLSALILGCSAGSLHSRLKERQITGQTCDATTCMTEMFLYVVTISLSAIDILWVGRFAYFVFNSVEYDEISTYKLTVLEFIHTTVAFTLLVSSFSAMSGVHDDTTVHFDVLIVVFVIFLQGVQHVIMMHRETIISYCSEEGVLIYDNFMTKYTVENTVLSYFLYTRLFVFLVIIGAVFVFIDRLQPSTAPGGFIASSNYYLRMGTLFLSLTPGVIADVSYELSHIAEMRTTGTYRPYVGANVWRRGVFLCAMIAYIIFSFKTEKFDTA